MNLLALVAQWSKTIMISSRMDHLSGNDEAPVAEDNSGQHQQLLE